MTFFQTIAVAFSMFSAIPMPQFAWTERNMRFALCAFPLIGAVIGGLCGSWVLLCQTLALPALLQGAGLCLIPVWITGGIHLDGFCDTCDALASHASPQRKQEILKDPHLGAFAAIRLCGYFLLTFALWACLPHYPAAAVCLGFCLSRSLSGLAVASFPLAKHTGLAHTFAAAADRKRVFVLLAGLSLLLGIGLCLCGIGGAAMAGAALLVFLYYRRMAQKSFGGLSGDLAGWFLQTAELWMLLALFAVQIGEEFL